MIIWILWIFLLSCYVPAVVYCIYLNTELARIEKRENNEDLKRTIELFVNKYKLLIRINRLLTGFTLVGGLVILLIYDFTRVAKDSDVITITSVGIIYAIAYSATGLAFKIPLMIATVKIQKRLVKAFPDNESVKSIDPKKMY